MCKVVEAFVRGRVLAFAAMTSLAALSACSTPASAETPPAEPLARRLRDEESLRRLAYCYGRGLDELSIRHADRAKGRQLATEIYASCFDPNVVIEVRALGAVEPLRSTTGVAAWVDFADGFFAQNKYSSTRHLMSNFAIELTGDDTARMTSYASIPHFLQAPEARDAKTAVPTVEYMIARYVDEARRGPDGSWRTTKKLVYLEEIWRGVGFFPGGQGVGQ